MRQSVSNIPVTPQFLSIKYHVELRQYSISETVFNFWQTMESQSSGTGSIQDPAAANARGNIKNLNNPDEMVLGYFGASGVSRKSIFIDNSEVPFNLSRFVYPDDCRTIPGGTVIKPVFWQ